MECWLQTWRCSNAFHVLTHLILMKILWGRSYYNPHLTVENKWGTEMLSNLLRSHSYCNRHHLPKISFFSLGTYPADTSQPLFFFNVFFFFFFISWRLITLQYCSGFCHTLTRISHGYTCIPHPDPPSHLPLHPIPLGLPSVPGLNACLMHPTWAGDLFHPR